VREIARQAALAVAEKGESMEVCFVSGGLREFVEAQVVEHPERFGGGEGPPHEPAEVVDRSGRSLGRGSDPYYRYTVGQRRGLGVAAGERLYVLGVEPAANRIVVGREAELLAAGLLGERLHWIGPREREAAASGDAVEATVKIRSRHAAVPATVRALSGGGAEVRFATPQRGVTPGQAAVFYRGTRVLGGCWIRGPLAPD
jgi:tRNA-specific 2-thiouridylase